MLLSGDDSCQEDKMNKFHKCVSNKHGDWTIGGKQYFLPISVLLDYIKTNNTTIESVPLNEIAWKGMHTADTDGYDQRYYDCDISFPGVVVEDGENPYDCKYRMIDGCHRIRKIMTETSKTHSDFYVLKNKEFIRLLETYESNFYVLKNEDEHIELIDTKNYFGFPVCVYRFKKHDELRDQLIQEVNTDGDSLLFNGGYIRSKPSKKPILLNEKDNALAELNTAYQKAYEHFYSDILDADLIMSRDLSGEDDNLNFVAKPIVTQSWVVGVPANPTPHVKDSPMGLHTHFLSPVCGSYYLSLDKNANGGNLVFANPMMANPNANDSLYLLIKSLRVAGHVKFDIIHPVEEGQIVIWAGVLPHAIEPVFNSKKQRISIITNSCVSPLPDFYRQYNYNISPFYQG